MVHIGDFSIADRDNKEIMLKAYEDEVNAFEAASARLREDEEFVLSIIRLHMIHHYQYIGTVLSINI